RLSMRHLTPRYHVAQFLTRDPTDVQPIFRRLRTLVMSEMPPQAREMLMLRHNHIAYSMSESVRDMVLYICPLTDYVRLGFYYGGRLNDLQHLLEGVGKRMRHIKVRSVEEANRTAVRRLLKSAWADAKARMKKKS